MGENNTPIVILCGGRGMRFHEATEYTPKPLIEIGNKPILWHIMKTYSYYGYNDFVLCLGYKGELIKKYFLDYDLVSSDFTLKLGEKDQLKIHNSHQEQNWKVTLAETGINAMTGARINRIEKYINSDIFMLTYGDAVADINLNRLLDFHNTHNKIGTVTAVPPLSRFGQLQIDGDYTVKGFKEKSNIHNELINGGFFVFNRRIFNYVNDEDSCSFEREPLEQLASDRELAAYIHDGYWQCMDTYRDWQVLNQEWENGCAPWKVW